MLHHEALFGAPLMPSCPQWAGFNTMAYVKSYLLAVFIVVLSMSHRRLLVGDAIMFWVLVSLC